MPVKGECATFPRENVPGCVDMWDEDEPKPTKRRVTPIPLDPFGVVELREYIAELQMEIARAEAAIAKKEGHRGEVERFFRT